MYQNVQFLNHNELYLTKASAPQLFLSINHVLLNMSNIYCISSIIYIYALVYTSELHITTIKRRISCLSKTLNKRPPYVCTSCNVGMSICATSLEPTNQR